MMDMTYRPFAPKPGGGIQYYRYRRDRSIYKALCWKIGRDEEAQAAFEQGKPVLSGFSMKINWVTGEREWSFSARSEEIEKRNVVIDAMNYRDEVQYSVNNSDNPTVIYRQLFGRYPHPWIEGRKGYYRPPRPENE